jgi:hypothetical protein
MATSMARIPPAESLLASSTDFILLKQNKLLGVLF